jgi:epoxide hydrolase 4
MKFDDPGWQHEFIEANGIRFHAVIHGEGPTVLMLHGFPENWYSWRGQIIALADAGFRAVAIDLRGFNQTDRPPRVRDYRADKLRDDVVGLVAALGGEPIHLVAHDWGGAVAWDVAARRPELLRSLSILNSPHPGVFMHHLLHNFQQLKRSWYMFYFQLPWLPETLMAKDIKRQFVRAFRGWAHRKEAFPDEVIEAFRRPMEEPGALRAGINYYRAAFRNVSAATQKLPKVAVPTQVIWGENDEALGKELCDDLDRVVSGPLEVHFIPDCSHWVQQEYPEAVNALLLDFLNRSPAGNLNPTTDS